MDKYDSSNDHYCYPDTNVLENKLNIVDIDELEEAEREITALTVEGITFEYPPYSLDYLKNIHNTLFSELYGWAGETRDIDISKGETRFCTWTRIEKESNKIFSLIEKDNWLHDLELDDFCSKLAEHYCEMNMLHPFREGNGRTQRVLFEHIALAAGYELDWADLTPDEWIQANIAGVNVNYAPMERIFRRIVVSVS